MTFFQRKPDRKISSYQIIIVVSPLNPIVVSPMYNDECCFLGSLDPQFVLHTKRVAGMFTQF